MIKNYTTKTENNLPILYFDGGSRGNPGEAAGAGVIVMPNGQQHIVSKYLKFATNNEAEYTGLIVGLQEAKNLGIQELTVKGDSQLVINQITGKWKVNSPHLKEFYNEAKRLIKKFETITLSWVRRNENHLADSAVNQCIDRGEKQNQVNQSDFSYKKVDLNLTPIDKLIKLGKRATQKDYTSLKSGRDEFTSLGLSELRKKVGKEIQQEIEKHWDGNDKYLAKVYRWSLRGLPPEMAICKVRTDAELEAKVTGKHPWLEEGNEPAKPQEDLKKNLPNLPIKFPYAKGDVIVIYPANDFQLKQQGVIINDPQLSKDGTWIITINVEDSNAANTIQ